MEWSIQEYLDSNFKDILLRVMGRAQKPIRFEVFFIRRWKYANGHKAKNTWFEAKVFYDYSINERAWTL